MAAVKASTTGAWRTVRRRASSTQPPAVESTDDEDGGDAPADDSVGFCRRGRDAAEPGVEGAVAPGGEKDDAGQGDEGAERRAAAGGVAGGADDVDQAGLSHAACPPEVEPPERLLRVASGGTSTRSGAG